MITTILQDVSFLNQLINSAVNPLKSWTTEANILEGLHRRRINDTESKNTILKFAENDQIIGCVLLVQKNNSCI
jgi:hypothetical protein